MLRIERKYLVPNHMLKNLRDRFSTFVRPDKYAKLYNNGVYQYTVRSIYLDSISLSCYAEKREGVMFRRKFRIRGYNYSDIDNNVVMEIKRKIENRQKKYRSLVRFDDVENMLGSGDLQKYVIKNGQSTDPVTNASRFMYHVKKHRFIPTCLITYEREAFHGLLDEGVRITFDKNIRCRMYPHIKTLYSDYNLKQMFKNSFILEIKYFRNQMPVWARSIVQEFKLRNDALSKYTIGIDVARNSKMI